MKRRHWIWSAIALVLLVAFIFPAVNYRHRFEEKNKYYTAAADLSLFSDYLSREELLPYLKRMQKSGITAAVIREEEKGYPQELIKAAQEAGLEIIAEPDLRNPSFSELEKQIEDYGIRSLKLYLNTWNNRPETPKKRAEICRLLSEQKLNLILTEPLEQLSNEHPEGYEEYLAAAEGRILRSFTGYETTPAHNGNYPYNYYDFLNSSLDRNIRVLIAAPLRDEGFSLQENQARLLDSIEKYCKKMEALGFSSDAAPALNSYPPKRVLPSAAAAALGGLMLAVVADLFFKGKKKGLFAGSIIACALLFGLTFLLPDRVLLLYPTVFAPLASCFCIAIVFDQIEQNKERGNFWVQGLITVGLTLGLLLLGGLCQGSMMNGWDYWINDVYFRGVKLSLILPVIFGFFWILRKELAQFRPSALKESLIGIWKSVRWYHYLILLVAFSLAGLYIIRSGNVSSISFFELKSRNGLVEWLQARPRTKEFIFGWPSLLLLVYEQRQKRKVRILSVCFGAIASVLFASAINTFCHAFTPIKTMVLRDLYGLLFGLVIGALYLGLYLLILKAIHYIKGRKS